MKLLALAVLAVLAVYLFRRLPHTPEEAPTEDYTDVLWDPYLESIWRAAA